MRIKNSQMEKSLNLREENLLKERAYNKTVTSDLEAKTQESLEHAQEEHALRRSLKYSQTDCEYVLSLSLVLSRSLSCFLVLV